MKKSKKIILALFMLVLSLQFSGINNVMAYIPRPPPPPPPTPLQFTYTPPNVECDSGVSGVSVDLTWRGESGYDSGRSYQIYLKMVGTNYEPVGSPISGWNDNADLTYTFVAPSLGYGETLNFYYRIDLTDSSGTIQDYVTVTVNGPPIVPLQFTSTPSNIVCDSGAHIDLIWRATSTYFDDRSYQIYWEFPVEGWQQVDGNDSWTNKVDIVYSIDAPIPDLNEVLVLNFQIFVTDSSNTIDHEVTLTVVRPDSDFDGLSDYDEQNTYGTDYEDWDTDDDLMSDGWEVLYGFDPNDESDGFEDPDGDNLANSGEYSQDTNPFLDDTDADGLLDGFEVYTSLTDPNDEDSDDDNLYDEEEVHDFDTDPNNFDLGCFRYYDQPYCGVAFVAWEPLYDESDGAYFGDLEYLNSMGGPNYNYVENLQNNGYYVFQLADFTMLQYMEIFLEALSLADIFDTRLFVTTLMHGSWITGNNWKIPNHLNSDDDIYFSDFKDHLTPDNIISSASLHYPDLITSGYNAEGQVEELIFYAAPCYAMTALVPDGLGYNLGNEDDGLKRIAKTGVIFGVKGEQGMLSDLPRFLHNYIINDFSLKESYDHAHDDASDVRYEDWGTDYIWDKPLYSIKKPTLVNEGKLDRYEEEYQSKLIYHINYDYLGLENYHFILDFEITAYIEDINSGNAYFTEFNWFLRGSLSFQYFGSETYTLDVDDVQDTNKIIIDIEYEISDGTVFNFHVEFNSDGTCSETHNIDPLHTSNWFCEELIYYVYMG